MADKRPTSTADMTPEQQEAFIDMCRYDELYVERVEKVYGWRRALVWGAGLLFCLACWAGVVWWVTR